MQRLLIYYFELVLPLTPLSEKTKLRYASMHYLDKWGGDLRPQNTVYCCNVHILVEPMFVATDST